MPIQSITILPEQSMKQCRNQDGGNQDMIPAPFIQFTFEPHV